MNFDSLFKELVESLKNDDIDKIEILIDKIVKYIVDNYFLDLQEKNFKIVHVIPSDIEKLGQSSFMFALGNSLNYSKELILYYKEKIKELLKTKEYENNQDYYNDVTFAMYLINSIFHELCHCRQYINFKNKFDSQTYINSLCYALRYPYFGVKGDSPAIKYLDQFIEGEAYGFGVKSMLSLCCNYMEKYNVPQTTQIDNFYIYNTTFHEAIYYLDKIPFVKTENGFHDIYTYSSRLLSKIDSKRRKSLISSFPLITFGINDEEQECKQKNPYELTKQYFDKEYITTDTKDSDLILDSYVYLLIPQLNIEVYNNLCQSFGKENIQIMMVKLSNKIDEMLLLYEDCYIKSIERVKKIIKKANHSLLQDIDEKYVEDKFNTAVSYLKRYKEIVNSLTIENRVTHTR